GNFEARVALSVARDVRFVFEANRRRRGTPEFAGAFVANVDRLAGRVGDGIVRPRRELVLVGIQRPGVARAGLGGEEAERRIRDYVDPRLRGSRALAENGDVFAAVVREAAQAVKEAEVRRHSVAAANFVVRARACGARRPRIAALRTSDLFGQRSMLADDHGSRDAL